MPDIKQDLEEVTDLISLPEVYLKIQRLMDDEASDISDFSRIISVDPNLSARVLRVVNSAYFGLAEPVDNMSRALNMLGLKQLHNMVLSASAVSSLDLPNDILPLQPFWHNSLYVGVLTQMMAEQLGLERTDRLFIAGLLHDIGHLVMCAKLPDHAREAIRFSLQSGRPIHECQQQLFDCHYGEIGAMLLENWKLPVELQTLVRYQPTPEQANGLALETTLLHLAHGCTTAPPPIDVNELISAEQRKLVGLDSQQINEYSDLARQVSIEMGKAILN